MLLTVPPKGNECSESGVVWERGELMPLATRFGFLKSYSTDKPIIIAKKMHISIVDEKIVPNIAKSFFLFV